MQRKKNNILEINPEFSSLTWDERIDYMYTQQIPVWELLKVNYSNFQSVKKKTFHFGDFRIDVQHNKARAKSTCAELSNDQIEHRACFLCSSNFPPEQEGFLILSNYLLLINPYPIFEKHLTISSLEHVEQHIESKIVDMLSIAKELENFTIFYNGPKCGASAPDHFHFQAVKKGVMPFDMELEEVKETKGKMLVTEDDIKITQVVDYLRPVIIFESEYKEPIDYFFEKVLKQLPVFEGHNEPMINLIANYENGMFRLSLFPRKAQRPSCFYKDGDDRMMVSPASVELGGIIITPREEDFSKITESDLVQIYKEVCLNLDIIDILNFNSTRYFKNED